MMPYTHEDRLTLHHVPPTPVGWEVWSIRPYQGPMTWSARPDGALSAVIMNATSKADVFARIAAYECDVERHLAEAEARLAAAEMSNIGRGERDVIESLTGALRAMRDRLQEKS